MAINYEWKITALKKAPSLDGLSDVITHINFEYKGTKGSGSDKIEAVFNGACPVGPPDSNDFKEFAKLTEADVLAWAQANHPVENMQDVISKTIADKEIVPDINKLYGVNIYGINYNILRIMGGLGTIAFAN